MALTVKVDDLQKHLDKLFAFLIIGEVKLNPYLTFKVSGHPIPIINYEDSEIILTWDHAYIVKAGRDLKVEQVIIRRTGATVELQWIMGIDFNVNILDSQSASDAALQQS